MSEPTRSRAVDDEQGRTRDRERPPLPEPLPHPVVDNHCHLDIEDGAWLETADALARAAEVGVRRIVQIGCDLPGAQWAVDAALAHEALVAGVALHPNEAPRLAAAGRLEEALAEIERLARSHEKVRAVGETGLDHFRTGPEGRSAQVESFVRHIDLAKRLDKTLVIHDRDAHDEILDVLDAEGAPERWVMHCFSGNPRFARACLDRGAFLSFAGTVTFKNAQPVRDALAITPLDRVLVETDAPFLTPTPYRGRPNASYLVPVTVRAMAEVRGDDLTTLCEAIDATTERAFGGRLVEAPPTGGFRTRRRCSRSLPYGVRGVGRPRRRPYGLVTVGRDRVISTGAVGCAHCVWPPCTEAVPRPPREACESARCRPEARGVRRLESCAPEARTHQQEQGSAGRCRGGCRSGRDRHHGRLCVHGHRRDPQRGRPHRARDRDR